MWLLVGLLGSGLMLCVVRVWQEGARLKAFLQFLDSMKGDSERPKPRTTSQQDLIALCQAIGEVPQRKGDPGPVRDSDAATPDKY